MMFNNKLFTIFAAILFVSIAGFANAGEGKPKQDNKGWFGWGQWHGGLYDHYNSRNSDFIPYAETGRNEHTVYKQNVNWKPEDWASQYDNIYKPIENFYKMDVIEKQYVKKKNPILVVGSGFYHLSGKDKYKLMKYLDYVYGLGKTDENAYFRIEDWYSENIIGIYTSKYGLQLQ